MKLLERPDSAKWDFNSERWNLWPWKFWIRTIRMTQFGRFEFKADKPSEVYEGDYMTLERGYVRIFKGNPESFLPELTVPKLLAAIHLDTGQSVREIKPEVKTEAKQTPTQKLPVLKTSAGRKFR